MEDKFSSKPEADKLTTTREAAKAAARNLKKYGSTPVIYGPTRGMLRKPAKLGLRSDIENATTIAEVKSLVAKGKTEYKKVTPGTVRKWEKRAAVRISQLSK